MLRIRGLRLLWRTGHFPEQHKARWGRSLQNRSSHEAIPLDLRLSFANGYIRSLHMGYQAISVYSDV